MSDQYRWFKSSYSDGEGGNCLEVALEWRKSSRSDSEGGACVEVASCPRTVRVRDSKRPAGAPQLTVPAAAWAAFVTRTGAGA